MPLMDWSPALDIGVEPMNREHREILNAINAVYDGAEAGMTGPALMQRISTLGGITQRHFVDEERFMAQTGFPGLEAHKEIHAKLLTDFTAHVAAIEKAGGVAGKDFFQFLHLWLSAHIKHIDRKYGAHATGARAA